MVIKALAVDYDGTIAEDGKVKKSTIDSLKQFKESGRCMLLVTGRELDELLEVFPEYSIFNKIIAENGALLYTPKNKKQKLLTPPPSLELVELLKSKGIVRISVGKGIIATWRPWEDIVLKSISQLGLELQVIFNKDAVMILPSGINKASGLKEALKEMKIHPVNVAAAGDAENDHSFIMMCGYSAAVSNAIESLKQEVNIKLSHPRGEGVSEFIKILSATTTLE